MRYFGGMLFGHICNWFLINTCFYEGWSDGLISGLSKWLERLPHVIGLDASFFIYCIPMWVKELVHAEAYFVFQQKSIHLFHQTVKTHEPNYCMWIVWSWSHFFSWKFLCRVPSPFKVLVWRPPCHTHCGRNSKICVTTGTGQSTKKKVNGYLWHFSWITVQSYPWCLCLKLWVISNAAQLHSTMKRLCSQHLHSQEW